MKKLDGKVAVITGGNSGLGLAIAREFSRQGAKVALFGRNKETLAEAKQLIEGECLTVQGYVQDNKDLDRLFAKTREKFGQIDTVVANAGGAIFQPFTEVTEETFDSQSSILFRGLFFTVQKGVALMKDGGTVILLSSVAGIKGVGGMTVYSAAKAAVRSLARTLTTELAPRGIRVNVLSPGPIETPIFKRMGIPEDQIGQAKEGFKGMVPLGRFGSSEEMASAALFLASDDSSYVAGVDLFADGGLGQV